MNCFRFLDFKNLSEVDALTIHEYELLIKAYELKIVDKNYFIHLQAFLNRNVKAEKRIGKRSKPVYDKFDKFFNYDQQTNRVLNKKQTKSSDNSQFSGLGKLLRKGG